VLAIRGHSCRLNEKRRSGRLQRPAAEAKSERKTVSGQNPLLCIAPQRVIAASVRALAVKSSACGAAARVRGIERLGATE
jgi:hypothetical protein